jgi:hypothetical protein
MTQSYPLTIEQEAMWLHDRLYHSQSIYLESWGCRLRGAVDMSTVEWAAKQIVARHPALHSSIRLADARLVQSVLQPGRPLVVEHLSCAENTLDVELPRLVRRPLDLRVSPVRLTCLRLGPADHVLVWQFHHLVVDDWALSILESDFRELYCARVAGRHPELPPLPLHPGPYAAAQRAKGVDPGLVDYWLRHLRGAPLESTVPPDRAPPDVPSHQGHLVRFRIDEDLGDGIRGLARRSRTTPFVIAAAGLAALLQVCNGSADQMLGTVVSRRGAASLDQMFTCLADLLPLRLQVRTEESFAELVGRTKRVVADAVAHRDLPFSTLLREMGGPRTSHRPLLCQVGLVIDDIPKVSLDMPGVQVERLHVPSGIVKMDLEITLVKEGGCYQGFLVYADDLFHAETAQAVQAAFLVLLERVVARPGLALGRVLSALPLPMRVREANAAPYNPPGAELRLTVSQTEMRMRPSTHATVVLSIDDGAGNSSLIRRPSRGAHLVTIIPTRRSYRALVRSGRQRWSPQSRRDIDG